ncbi:hypothetical protein TNIN_91381 [Trichonephila inaurata madagascariensis]|uniref:Uncharacterized protein n=1 Tax=Trichonephila inaurata madagascariensis TaxID=2747483 RepID=A0A8X6WWK8_9ARAC|nr:hypothetical protein TNIN_91381 [Trichonephila inaurata madagascariensis]
MGFRVFRVSSPVERAKTGKAKRIWTPERSSSLDVLSPLSLCALPPLNHPLMYFNSYRFFPPYLRYASNNMRRDPYL